MVDQTAKFIFAKGRTFYFSRRVPKTLQARFNTARIVTCLHTGSERRALQIAAGIAVQLDAVWAQARLEEKGLISKSQASQSSRLSPTVRKRLAPSETLAGPTLSDALTLYLRLKGRGKGKAFVAYTERNLGYARTCIGNLEIESIGRSDATKFRDYLIDKGLITSSIKRVFATVRAAVSLTISERGLNCLNPFSGTFIPDVGDKRLRVPITNVQILAIQKACIAADDEKRWLIALISDTGLRLAEAVGLVREDILLEGPFPHLNIRTHPWRSLKTPSSERTVPLVGASLWAAQRVLLEGKGRFAFPSYASPLRSNANSASAALNKWLRVRLPRVGSFIHSGIRCVTA